MIILPNNKLFLLKIFLVKNKFKANMPKNIDKDAYIFLVKYINVKKIDDKVKEFHNADSNMSRNFNFSEVVDEGRFMELFPSYAENILIGFYLYHFFQFLRNLDLGSLNSPYLHFHECTHQLSR